MVERTRGGKITGNQLDREREREVRKMERMDERNCDILLAKDIKLINLEIPGNLVMY